MPEKDPLFKDRVLIVDADTAIPTAAQTRGNSLKLPCANGARGTARTPENTLKAFLLAMAEAPNGPLREALLRLDVTNPSTDRVLNAFFPEGTAVTSQRVGAKSWWVTHWARIKKWGVIREWAAVHPAETATFLTEFENAVAKTASRVKLAALAKR